MKIRLASTLLALGITSVANAALYTFNNVALGPGDTLYADSANNLLSGSIVSVGTFSSGFNVAGNLTDQAALLSNFTILSSVSAGSTSVTLEGPGGTTLYPGYTEYAPIQGALITAPNTLIGRTLYAFIGNASSLATSTQFALFQVATSIADDVPNENEYVVNPGGITPLIGTIGTFNGDAGAGTGIYRTLQTAVIVPEPSAALLGALGALGLLRRRRA